MLIISMLMPCSAKTANILLSDTGLSDHAHAYNRDLGYVVFVARTLCAQFAEQLLRRPSELTGVHPAAP